MRWLIFAGYFGTTALSLWLRSAVPVHAAGSAMHDDFLFVRLAYQLGAGLWLGPYDNLTLAKGMAYPAFILASFVAGIPLKFAEQATYLAGAGLAAWLVTRLTGKHGLAFLLFVCLAFNPVLWTDELARVIREGLYIGLSLIVLVLAVAILLLWRAQNLTTRLVLPIALGFFGAVYWLTREEGIWLMPAAGVLVGFAVIDIWRRPSRDDVSAGRGRSLMHLAAAGATAGIVFTALVGAVAGMNHIRYGAFTTNEFKSKSFLSAYGALSRIQPHEWQRYVTIPADAREKAYAVSPAAAELRSVLDGEHGEAARRFACREMRRDLCPETPSGWFMWVVRDAVAASGHYSSARDAFAFYDRLAEEINTACDDGRLTCGPARASILPPFRWHYIVDAAAEVPALLRVVTSLGDGDVGSRPSDGFNFSIELVETLVGPVSRSATPTMTWVAVAKAADPPRILVRDRSGAPFAMQLRPTMPVVSETADGRKFASVEVETDCLRPTCDLVIRAGENERAFPISSLVQDDATAAGAVDVTITRLGRRTGVSGSRVASETLQQRKLALARGIAAVYTAAVPVLSLLAGLGLLLAFALRRGRSLHDGLLALTLACGVAVATRIAMLAYINVTWIPVAINVHYASPATPFLISFVVLGLYLGVLALIGLVRPQGRTSERAPQ